jgi:predicted ATP-grasp superfamily ATP-dependent carboligase
MKNVANRLIDCGSNYSKPYQLKYLQIFHLKIPEFSIMANSLQRKFDKRIIYKSTSFERSIVQELKKNDMDRPITSPVLFQELLEGINIRVHVLKNKVFSLEILSNKIDYRYSNTTVFNEIRLPKKIEEECIEITRQCNFIYSGIDLIKRDKYYYLLEVNPAPGFHYFEEQMKKKAISTELMNILS